MIAGLTIPRGLISHITKGSHKDSSVGREKNPDRGFGERFSSSGLREKKVLVVADVAWVVRLRQVVSERENLSIFYSREERRIHHATTKKR
jgi:hypothetical protein